MAQKNIDYSRYEVYDFLMDPLFKQWVSEDDAELQRYWANVISCYPEKEEMIVQARRLATSLNKSTSPLESSRKNIWANIEQDINKEEAAGGETSIVKPKFSRLLKYAAILFCMAASFVIYKFNGPSSSITVATGYGETKSVILPDSSFVQLGANSALTYHRNPNDDHVREVWVNGEAKFIVKHLNKNPENISSKERFIVHMKNEINVEVLGTVFTVNDRRAKADIDLESGSVKVTSPSVKQLLLKPGESVELTVSSSPELKKQKHKALVHQWQNNTLLMSGTTIEEIVAVMEDNYGINIRIDAKEFNQKKLDGTLPLDDEQKALMILSSITDSQIVKKGDVIVFSAK